jgi:hypothetical protein
MCLECDEPILSNCHDGQDVKLFLLKEGQVLQTMQGPYNGYGCTFKDNLEGSDKWDMVWDTAVDLHFNGSPGDGFAAIHTECLKDWYNPQTISKDDPDQGWGSGDEWLAL